MSAPSINDAVSIAAGDVPFTGTRNRFGGNAPDADVIAPPERARTSAFAEGSWHHVSASQVKQYRECPRKWWWQSVQGLRSPETGAMSLGKLVHAELETYYKGGAPPAHKVALAAHAVAPPRTEYELIEVSLEDPPIHAAGVPFMGFIDRCVAAPGVPPLVLDWKTTSDFRWAKTVDDLRTDPQSVAYGRWAARRFYGPRALEYHPGAAVNVMFVYTLTRGKPAARVVEVPFTVAALEAPWSEIEADVSAMRALINDAPTRADLGKVPARWGECGAYGGCPHRLRCEADKTGFVSLSSVLDNARKVESNMGDLDALFSQPAMQPISSSATAAPGLELYINTVPVKGVDDERPKQLAEVLRAYEARVVVRWNETHPNDAVRDIQQIEFGKWKGPLAAMLREDPPRGMVLARSGSDVVEVALHALRPIAAVVWEGVR